MKMKPETRERWRQRSPHLVYEFGSLRMTQGLKRWTAVSGRAGTYEPIPIGWYLCTNFRVRTKEAMMIGDIGFSVNLDPLFKTTRTLLRIHPDGKLPGTQGCIGVNDPNLQDCFDTLKALLPNADSEALLYVRNNML